MPPDIKILAERAYPGLKQSGCCSAHPKDGHYECKVCYPDYRALLKAHVKVSSELYGKLLELSGLSAPPDGRVGTNAIIAQLVKRVKKE